VTQLDGKAQWQKHIDKGGTGRTKHGEVTTAIAYVTERLSGQLSFIKQVGTKRCSNNMRSRHEVWPTPLNTSSSFWKQTRRT
jgi:hypothetical protein